MSIKEQLESSESFISYTDIDSFGNDHSHMDGIMHNRSNPFYVGLSNRALKVLTFLVNQAAEIVLLKPYHPK